MPCCLPGFLLYSNRVQEKNFRSCDFGPTVVTLNINMRVVADWVVWSRLCVGPLFLERGEDCTLFLESGRV